jgi:hypothetical protein
LRSHKYYAIYCLVVKFSFLKFYCAALADDLLNVKIEVLLEVKRLIWDLLHMLAYLCQSVYPRSEAHALEALLNHHRGSQNRYKLVVLCLC